MSWRRLDVLVRYLPRDSSVALVLYGDQVTWDVADHLLARAVDVLQGANWQRGGGKGKRPKRIQRPGEKGQRKQYGKAISVAEMRRILDNWGTEGVS